MEISTNRVQKKVGNACEVELIKKLIAKRYWCHLFASTLSGQPCDIIAFNDTKLLMIDAKHCDKDKFYTSRVEANQRTCFDMVESVRGKICGFAIYFESDNTFRWLPYQKDMKKSYDKNEMELLDNVL